MKTTAVESVKRLLSLTYTITDPTSLEIITTAVKSLIEDAEKTVPRIGGIHQRVAPLRKRVAMRKYRNRSGIKASILRKHSKISVELGNLSYFN